MPIFSGWDEARWRREAAIEEGPVASEAWSGLMEEFDAQMREEVQSAAMCRHVLATMRHASACVLAGGRGRMRALEVALNRPVVRVGPDEVHFSFARRRWQMRLREGQIILTSSAPARRTLRPR